MAESKAQKGGWVAIKVVEKIDLLKTKKIVNPTNPDSETESINGNHIPISSKIAEEDTVIQGMEFQGHKLMQRPPNSAFSNIAFPSLIRLKSYGAGKGKLKFLKFETKLETIKNGRQH